MPRRVGLLGYPLGHTLSPVFQQAAFDALGLDLRYETWETTPEALEGRLRSLAGDPDVLGFNVTIPHKERVFSLVERVEGPALRIGAVNTVVKREGHLVGFNTDAEGFLRGLRQEGGFDPRGRRALLLGAGGAGRAVAVALAEAGIASLTIANRTEERARSLATLVSSLGVPSQALPLGGKALEAPARSADLIVNTTSVGLRHTATEGQTPLPGDLIPPTALVCDIIYAPPETPLLREARRVGARALNGIPMLLHQGALSFSLWTGREAPLEVMRSALFRALGV